MNIKNLRPTEREKYLITQLCQTVFLKRTAVCFGK